MSQVAQEAKAEYNRAKDRITKALKATPADKQNWSPSPTARTPIQLVAHAAMGTGGIGGMLQGKPFPYDSFKDMDTKVRQMEKEYNTADQALALLETNSAEYCTWLDTLTDEQLAATVNFPMGSFPMAAAITFAADHMRGHSAQLEYLQTIYGDHDMAM